MKTIFTSLLLILSLQSYSQNLNDSLLLYYPFDGNTYDESGNGYNGTEYGVSFSEDRFGIPNSACNFDGIDNYKNYRPHKSLKNKSPKQYNKRNLEKCLL